MSRPTNMAVHAALWLLCGCGSTSEAPTPTAAAPTPTPVVTPPAIDPPSLASIRADVTALSSDEMDGRRPGTEGGKRAVAYIIDRMRRIGLQPGAPGGGWTQVVPMRAVATDADRARLELTHGGARSILRFGDDWVGSTYRAAGTHRYDAELVFVGYGITAPEHDWDDYEGVDMAGKIALVLVGDPPLADARFAGPALTYYGRWSYKLERALAAGALGCLIVHESEPASYGWNVVRNSWSHENFHVAEPGAALPDALALQGWVTHEIADDVAREAGSSLSQWHTRAIDPAFVA
ncbi:MAG: hypothetical protein IAG13_31540, partial [Deltaproteobacteria bacterium]|nr:hypothetical protein [Nannocystaceae bacterium]